MSEPRHSSLEKEWFAVVPPARVSRLTLLRWHLTWKLLSLRPIQRIFEKRYGS